MSLNGHATPLKRVIESHARAIESQTLYGSLLLGQNVDWAEMNPDGTPDPWVPSGSRRRNRGQGESQPVHFTEEELHRVRGRSRELCATNEFAICGMANRQNYVIGKGLAYRAAALPSADAADPGVIKLVAMVQAVIDAFADSCELPAVERECMGRLDRDGEYLLRLFPQSNGILAVRRIEPENVRPPDGWGGDARYSYGVETVPGDVETPVAYWVRERPDEPGCGPVRVPAEDVVHDRLNVDATSKRGVPTWYPVEENLRRAEDLLASMTSMAKTRAKIAAHRKLSQATQATARSLLDALTYASVADPGSQQTVSFERMRYGSILTTGGNVEWEFPNAQVEADQFVAVLQAELRAIAARIQQPEWMLTADSSNANLASSLVAEAPSTKGFEAIQHQFKRRFGEKKVAPGRSLIWRQIDFAVRCGILPRAVYQYVGVQCEPPSLVVRNRLAEAQTDQIYLESGVKSIPTIRLQQGLDGAQEDRGFASHPPAAPPEAPPAGDPAGQPQPTDPGGARAKESFNPDQPRDEDGKFASGSGGGGVEPHEARRAAEDAGTQTKRQAEDRGRESSRAAEDAHTQAARDSEDAEHEAAEKARDAADEHREASRDQEDAQTQAKRDAEDSAFDEAEKQADAQRSHEDAQRDAKRDAEDAAIDAAAEKGEISDEERIAAHEKNSRARDREDAATDRARDKEDTQREKAREQKEREREKEDAATEKARDREDAAAEKDRERASKERDKVEAAREKEDAAREKAREKEDAAIEKQRDAEDAATDAAREKEDAEREPAGA